MFINIFSVFYRCTIVVYVETCYLCFSVAIVETYTQKVQNIMYSFRQRLQSRQMNSKFLIYIKGPCNYNFKVPNFKQALIPEVIAFQFVGL